jgi:molybdenum ABC transporter molybdate-binding protein
MNPEPQEWMSDWTVGVRLWMERSGEAILGPGRLELLEAIDRCHSISAAARELGMSYRRAWLLVDGINRAAGEQLVHRQTGGRDGGGAELTARARAAIAAYRALQIRVQQTASSSLTAPSPSNASIVHVAAAASLESVLHCLLADFAPPFIPPARGGDKGGTASVRTICGGSDELADQILNGLGVELFLSAAQSPLDRLERAGVVAPASRTLLGANRLSAITAAPRITELRRPRALLQAPVHRIALADPSCPLGHYSRAYLEPLGLWNAIRERALFLDNPRGVVAAVESGRADVGLVYRSDAAATHHCRILFTSRAAQPEIRYTAALTRRGEQSVLAHSLLSFLTSIPAQRCLRRFGFHTASATRSRRGS